MALHKIAPFTCSQYSCKTYDFAQWMAEYVHKSRINGRTGWLAHFGSYQFLPHEKSWKDGLKSRSNFHVQLKKTMGANRKLIATVNTIVMTWGHINKGYGLQHAAKIRNALHTLQSDGHSATWTKEQINGLFNFTRSVRIASHSKTYEMFEPNKWTIYDSRVSKAIVCLVHHYWKAKGRREQSSFLTFPHAEGRDWKQLKKQWKLSRPALLGFPVVGTSYQGALAFIYASWILRQVAEILRSDSKYGYPPTMQAPNACYPLDPNWQVYHVEMALWMLGDKDF